MLAAELRAARSGSIRLVECKASRTVSPAMAAPMQRLAAAFTRKRPRGAVVEMFVVHQRPKVTGSHPRFAPRRPSDGLAGFPRPAVTEWRFLAHQDATEAVCSGIRVAG
jgi:hypothetical protein